MASASKDSLDCLVDMLHCPVCLETFRDPRLLVCGHSFCKSCLESIFDIRTGSYLACPTCRKDTYISKAVGASVSSLPRPVLMVDMQEKIMELQKKHDETQTQLETRSCEFCESTDTPGKYFCFNCGECLCEECFMKHKSMKAFAGHETTAVAENLFCILHPKQVLATYCTDCKEFLCKRCVFHHSDDHAVDNTERVAAKSRMRLIDLLGAIKNSVFTAEEVKNGLLQKTLKLQENVKNNQKDISTFRGIIKLMEANVNSMEENMENVLASENEKIKTDIERLKKLGAAQSALIGSISYLVYEASDIELIQAEGGICSKSDILADLPKLENVRTDNTEDNADELISQNAGSPEGAEGGHVVETSDQSGSDSDLESTCTLKGSDCQEEVHDTKQGSDEASKSSGSPKNSSL